MDKYFPVSVGDRVMINPEYWSSVERSGLKFSEPYRSNGPDHIYTVTHVFECSSDGHYASIRLDGKDDGWDNRYEYLLPVESAQDFDAPESISSLFN